MATVFMSGQPERCQEQGFENETLVAKFEIFYNVPFNKAPIILRVDQMRNHCLHVIMWPTVGILRSPLT